MKTLVKIETDYQSTLSYDNWVECINEIAKENKFFVDIENKKYFNPVNNNCEKGANSIDVTAIGYSQGEWQKYTIYHNSVENNEELNTLIGLLKKSFTHKNDYFVAKYEYTEINDKIFISPDFYDCTSISIDSIEFPTIEDVKNAYIDEYGNDFDKIEINI